MSATLNKNVHRLHPAPDNSMETSAVAAAPRILEIVAEADRSCLKMVPKYQDQVEHLSEKIAVIDADIAAECRATEQAEARWSAFGNHAEHWTPLSWTMMWFGIVVLAIAETALSATVMAGLDLTDLERWLVAAGCMVGATLGVEAFAFAWRAYADDQRDNLPVAARHRSAISFGAASIVLGLFGQFLARESFAEQAQQAGGSGVSWMVAGGLTLVQCGLFGAAGFFLYARLPHIRTQQAYKQCLACRKRLTRLHTQRAKLAAPLNKAVFTLRARWAEQQAIARSLTFEYLQEMQNGRGRQEEWPKTAPVLFDGHWLLPVPVWVKSADELTLSGQADVRVANGGTSSAAEMLAAAARRDAMLLGKAYPPLEAPVQAHAPDAKPLAFAKLSTNGASS